MSRLTNVLYTKTTLPLLNVDCVPGGGVYVHFRVSDVTNPGGMSCSSYQPFVIVLKKLFL